MKRLMFLGILSSLAIAVCCQKKIKLPDPSQHKNITKISTLRLNMPTAPSIFEPAEVEKGDCLRSFTHLPNQEEQFYINVSHKKTSTTEFPIHIEVPGQ